jgi:hypothetical protein
VNGASVPASASAMTTGRPCAIPAAGGRPPSVPIATGSVAAVAARNCTAVTAIGSRPFSSRVWVTVNDAESSSDTPTRPSPLMVAPPPCPALATRATPASDAA